MSVEAKVGAFTVGGLMLLGGATVGLGDFHFGSNDDLILYAGFKQVVGLQQQSDVRLSGVFHNANQPRYENPQAVKSYHFVERRHGRKVH